MANRKRTCVQMNVKQFAACDIVIIFDMQFHGMRYDGFVGSVAVIFHTL